jgi:hypothetical protein
MRFGAWFAVAYVAVVLGVDLLASAGVRWPIDWSMFVWHGGRVRSFFDGIGLPQFLYGWTAWKVLQSFDYFKFVFWFLVPFCICLWHMDWGAFGWKRWKPMDKWFLLGAFVVLAAAVLVMPLFPELRKEFPSLRHLSGNERWMRFGIAIFWNLSWVVGWEFMHRYFLLRRLDAQWPKYGWVLVPIFEVAYHYRNYAMAAGMGVFSIVLTIYARERKNVLLPFLAHLFIELFLVAFMLLV